MARKLFATIQFGSGLLRHAMRQAINLRGYTHCSIWLPGTIGKHWPRGIERKPAQEVTCWLCRKGGGFLKPKPGTVLTATKPGLKIHCVSAPFKAADAKRIRTPCSLDFTGERDAVVKVRRRAAVTCGHCMRFAFE